MDKETDTRQFKKKPLKDGIIKVIGVGGGGIHVVSHMYREGIGGLAFEEMPGIHRKILKAIRENMQEEGLNPDDGKKEKRLPWGTYMEDCPEASHMEMYNMAEDDDIEYTITVF